MKRLLLLSLCSLLLFMAAPVRAQAVLTGVRPIADGEGNPVTAVDPLPVSLAGGGFSGDVNLTEVGSVVLSAAAALGDVDTNPTTATFGAAGMVWDPAVMGGTWGRMRGSSGRLSIDLDLVNGSQISLGRTTASNSLPFVLASDDYLVLTTSLSGVAAPTRSLQIGGQIGGIFWPLHVDASGYAGTDLFQIGGTAVSTGQGASGAGVLRVMQARSGGNNNTGIAIADQVIGPENADIAANASRFKITILSTGTGVCLIAAGNHTGGGAVGFPVAGGAADDDGTGRTWWTHNQAAIWIWDLAGAGTCKWRYHEETF